MCGVGHKQRLKSRASIGYAPRNDAESINRNLEDTLFLGRPHSVGRLRQQVDLIGYALLVNGLTVLRHERRGKLPTAAQMVRLPPASLRIVRRG